MDFYFQKYIHKAIALTVIPCIIVSSSIQDRTSKYIFYAAVFVVQVVNLVVYLKKKPAS